MTVVPKMSVNISSLPIYYLQSRITSRYGLASDFERYAFEFEMLYHGYHSAICK